MTFEIKIQHQRHINTWLCSVTVTNNPPICVKAFDTRASYIIKRLKHARGSRAGLSLFIYTANNEYQEGTLLNINNFRTMFPFVYFDLTKPKIVFKDGTINLTFRYELSGTTVHLTVYMH